MKRRIQIIDCFAVGEKSQSSEYAVEGITNDNLTKRTKFPITEWICAGISVWLLNVSQIFKDWRTQLCNACLVLSEWLLNNSSWQSRNSPNQNVITHTQTEGERQRGRSGMEELNIMGFWLTKLSVQMILESRHFIVIMSFTNCTKTKPISKNGAVHHLTHKLIFTHQLFGTFISEINISWSMAICTQILT